MLGLDVYNGNKTQLENFGSRATVTFPLLLSASGTGFSREDLVVVDPDGTVAFSGRSLSSSTVRSNAIAKVNELLAQIPSPAPEISVQERVDFGTIDAGQTGQETITITNTGTATLEITGIQSDVSGLTFDTTMFTLEPNGSQTVTITFPSSAEGTFSGNITISSNDPNSATSTLSVSVSVQPPPVPAISVQERVNFDPIVAGQTGEQTITIENTGTATLQITGIESDVSGLTFDTTMFSLEPNGSQTVTITFPSSTEGTFSGNITISSNDPNSATSTLSVSIIVQPPPVPAISVRQTAVNFDPIVVGQTGRETIAITNTGTASLNITGITSDVSGLTFDTTMFTLESDASKTVTIRFPSSTEGTFSGTITISSNDPNTATQTLSVSITVQPPPAPAISVQQTAVDFGTVAFAQSVQQTIVITNTGTADLEITGIESDVSGLTFDTTTFTLAPGGSQTVTIAFPSSTVGEFSGTITISSNDPNTATQTLSVSVTVQTEPVPMLVVGTPAIDFGSIDAEKTAQKTFTITNTGTAPLEITGIESDVSGLTFDTTMFTLAPNSSRTITITFPESMVGTFSGLINILSNDPDRAAHTLRISGIVQPLSEEARSDFDGNGVIAIADFLLLVSAFGTSDPKYDIDGDGVVGISDFLIFVNHFGKKLN